MLTPVLAFRPARVVERLAARSAACPLSSKDLLRVAAALRLTLPLVRATTPGVARAALVAAKQVGSVLGLALPPGLAPEAWFSAVTQAADELAAGLPIFLAGEVVVAGRREAEVEAAFTAAWRLADAGLTHLTVDLSAVPAEDRAEVLERVAAPALERGLGLDCVVQAGGLGEARPLFEDLARRDAAPDLASLRCEAPGDAAEAHSQVKDLLALCAALSGTPVLRRGPVTAALLSSLNGSPVAGCEDGGAAADAGVALIPPEPEAAPGPDALQPERPVERQEAGLGEGRQEDPGDGGGEVGAWWLDEESPPPRVETRTATELGRAEAALSEGLRSRVEAWAYLEVLDFLERLGTAGSAAKVARALERTLADPGA